MSSHTVLLKTACSVLVLASAGWCICGCAPPAKPQLAEQYTRKIEDAIRGIVPDNEQIDWQYINMVDRQDDWLRAEGRFWARLKRDQVRLSHGVVVSFDVTADDIESLVIDGNVYQKDQAVSQWWDGITEHNPEEKFTHLSNLEKNELWWTIHQRVDRQRHEASTTITWSLHDLIQLTNRYRVSPIEISEFYEYGQEADWRSEEAPATLADN